jgi:mRNA interferase YafQ
VRNPVSGAQFRRDVKLAQKRGKDMAKLREVIQVLIDTRPLPPRCKDHPLGGDWKHLKHFRDCHIEPDWLLIYKIDGDDLYLVRTGTHSDLFWLRNFERAMRSGVLAICATWWLREHALAKSRRIPKPWTYMRARLTAAREAP